MGFSAREHLLTVISVALAVSAAAGGTPRRPAGRSGREGRPVPYREARVAVHTTRVTGELPSGALGSNVQFISGGDGILDPQTGALREAAVAEVARLRLGTIRFPGGALSQGYHWRDGVGPAAGRPDGISYFDGRLVSNEYGTDEHMELCERVGAEATITVNFESGTPREAANWVEYVNGEVPDDVPSDWTVDSWSGDAAAPPGYFAWLRSQFGHPEPYGVRRWEVGNEVYDRWSETISAAEYARQFLEFAAAMKAVDPSIEIAAVGYEWADRPWRPDDDPWNATVASIAGQAMDALHVHTYLPLGDGRTIILYSNGGVDVPVAIREPGTYTLSFLARGFNMFGAYPLPDGRVAILRVSVDGRTIRDLPLDRVRAGRWSLPLDLQAGDHTITLAFVNDAYDPSQGIDLDVALDREAVLDGPGGRIVLELADLGDACRSAMAGSIVYGRQIERIRALLEERTGRNDIAVWVTEMNTLYGLAGFNLHEAERHASGTAMAAMAIAEIGAGATIVQPWSLLENWFFGFMTDARSLGKRCTFHVWRLLGEAAGGDLAEVDVSGPTWDLDHPVPGMDTATGLPALRAMAVVHKDRIDVLLANTLPDAGLDVRVVVDGGDEDATATVVLVDAAGPSARDLDPEDDLFPWTDGIVGRAVEVDADRPLWLPSEGRLDPDEGSIELWARPEWSAGDGADHRLLSLGGSLLLLVTGDGWLGAVVAGEGSADDADLVFTAVSGWEPGQWHHVALTWDRDTWRLYLDGREAAWARRQVLWTWIDPVPGLVVGSATFATEGGWDGAVDEVRLLSRTLSADEIAADAEAGRVGAPLAVVPGTTALLHLDGTVHDVVQDERTRVETSEVPASFGSFRVRIPPAGFVRATVPPAGGG